MVVCSFLKTTEVLENIQFEHMSGYPIFWFMITKKQLSKGKHSDSQIFLKTERLDLQMMANNSTRWYSFKKQHEKMVAILINDLYLIFFK